MRLRFLLPILVGLTVTVAAVPATAQTLNLDETFSDTDIQPTDVVFWDVVGAEVTAKGQLEALFRLRTEQSFTIYTDKLTLTPPTGYQVTNISYPPTRKIVDPIGGKEVEVYYGGDFRMTLSGPPLTVGAPFEVKAKYIGCTTVICLFPYTEVMAFQVLKVAQSEAVVSSSGETTAATAGLEEETFEESWAKRLQAGGLSFSILILVLFLGGMVSNLTPCVYPMIPITLRVLAKQGKSPYLSASMYSLGIVVTYTVLGVAAAASGGMFGALMASKAFNALFAVVMIMLGVSMLGFGNFAKLQMLGSQMGSGKPSLRNTFVMGAGAGLVASPCTGPVLAALLAYTAKNHTVAESSVLLFVYSLGFGLPYVALGGAAAKVSQVKVPPQVQVGVKLFFAAVMFGLGLYYLRIPFYSIMDELKSIWPTVAAVALTAGIIGAVVWTIVPRLQNNKLSMILPTSILGVGIFAASQWVTATPSISTLTWYKSEAQAFAAASKIGKPVLIDMWAEWCEACKKMDATTFRDDRVVEALSKNWVLLKLDLTESNDANDLIQEKFELQSLPTLVLMPPDGNVERKRNIKGYVSANALLNNTSNYMVD